MNIQLDTFISLDLETTGIDSATDQITEIGAVKYVNGVKVESFSQLVNPGIPILQDITDLTGIDNDMVADAPSIKEVMPELEAFLGDTPLVLGQNVRFDISFLRNHLSLKYHAFLEQFYLDSAALARLCWPGLKSYGLSSLAEFLGITVDTAHRALPDAEVTAQVYLYQLAAIKNLDQNLKNLVAGILFGLPFRGQVLESLANMTDSLPSPIPFAYDYGDNIIGEKQLEQKTDFVDIDLDEINEIFETRLREQIDDYEERPQQIEMAAKVAAAFNNAEVLLAEAPTGVGKSLSYLAPSLLWAAKNGEGVLLSTQTKNLQDQLFNKDIPMLRQAVNFDFRAVLIKGRGNYLCLFKYHELMNEAISSFNMDDRLALMSVVLWAETTRTGDFAECTGFYPGRFRYLWSRMSCEGNFCLGRVCRFYKKCYLYRIKNAAATAHLRVINHHLLFADFSSGGELVQSSGQAILDEAHNLEKVAAGYLGPELNHHLFITAFNQVYTIKPIETGFLTLVKSKFPELDQKTREEIEKTIGKIQSKLLRARGKIGEFFDKLSRAVAKLPGGYGDMREVRYNSMTQYISQDLIDDSIIAVKSIESMMLGLADTIEDLDDLKDKPELTIRARAIAQDIAQLRGSLEFLLYPDEDDFVYWLELGGKKDVRLISAPLNVGHILDDKLYGHLKTVVLCSATLSVAGNFEFYKNRLGFNLSSKERVTEVALDSPFNLRQNVGFFEAGYMPLPSANTFDKEAAKTIYKLFTTAKVRGMVLFTSYKTIDSVLAAVGSKLIAKGFELFVQNSHLSPFQLLSRYRQSPRGIIFGTDSFWEGVDLPGDELELLVITKLPFAVPDRPWTKANLEKIEKDGGNPFMDYSLPEAVIKFRQGFGRLIRKKTDRGCVVSLDSRLSGKHYGRLFQMSVKPPLRYCPNLESLIMSASKYLETVK